MLKVRELDALRELVSPSRLTHVVDVGANPNDGGKPPYLPMLNAGICRVTGFEPQQEALLHAPTNAWTERAVSAIRGWRR